MAICGLFTMVVFAALFSGLKTQIKIPSSTTGQTIPGKTFLKNSTWDGLVMNSGYMQAAKSRSVLECSLACKASSGCESFFYVPGDKDCILYDFVHAYITCAIGRTGARYYYREGSVPNTAASSSTGGDVHPACDVTDDVAYRTVCLSDNTAFTYRVFRTAVNQATALTNCHADGTELVKVLSWPKMQFLRHLIYNCSDYDLYTFWIDGTNAAATDFNDISQWVTEHGDGLPTTTDFWVSGHPNSPAIDHCVPMWRSFNYYWTDRACSYLYPYICEVPNL